MFDFMTQMRNLQMGQQGQGMKGQRAQRPQGQGMKGQRQNQIPNHMAQAEGLQIQQPQDQNFGQQVSQLAQGGGMGHADQAAIERLRQQRQLMQTQRSQGQGGK